MTAANPVLVGAQFVFFVVTAGSFFSLGALGVILFRRLPEGLDSEGLSWQYLVLHAVTDSARELLVFLGVLSLVALLLTVVAAYVKAGLCGVLFTADRQAPEGANHRVEFAVEVLAFFRDANRYFLPVFWLINLYALSVSIFAAFLLAAVALLVAGIVRGNWIPGAIAVFVAGVVAIVSGLISRAALLASCREAVASGVHATEAVRSGLLTLRRTAAHSAALFFLVLAVSVVLGGVFSIPRVLFELASPRFPNLVIWGTIAVVFQLAAYSVAEVLQVGSFMSLWNGPPQEDSSRSFTASLSLPPVAFVNTFVVNKPEAGETHED